MNVTLRELAEMCGGEIMGDAGLTITGAASIADALPGEITFFGNARYLSAFRKTGASAAFVPADFDEQVVAGQIRVADPTKAFQQLALRFAPAPIVFAAGIHPTAIVADDVSLGEKVSLGAHVIIEAGARIGNGSRIGANSYIGHASTIGEEVLIYPNVTVRERTRIGDRVILHSGVVLGADGFGFENVDGVQTKIPQLGIVQIDNDVEIGANTTVDRARFGRTWIQEGAKLDNLIQVGHNVIIGKHTIICAQTGIAGSTRIGAGVMLGGQVGIAGHLVVEDGAICGAQAGVTKNLGRDTYWSTPADPIREIKRQIAWVRGLGKLIERVKALEKKIGGGEETKRGSGE